MNSIAWQNIEAVIKPLFAAEYANRDAGTRVGMTTRLGGGGSGDVWGLDRTISPDAEDRVVKIYRNGARLPPETMDEEWETTEAIVCVAPGILPRLFEHGRLPNTGHGEACGYAIYERVHGRHPIKSDFAADEESWGRRLADAAIDFTEALQRVDDKPSSWVRATIKAKADEIRGIKNDMSGNTLSAHNQKLTGQLIDYIQSRAANVPLFFIHDDFHSENIFPDKSGKLRLIDPLVGHKPAEAMLQHIAPNFPGMTNAFMERYTERTGRTLDAKLVWALRALKYHTVCLRVLQHPLAVSDRLSCITALYNLDPGCGIDIGGANRVPDHTPQRPPLSNSPTACTHG